MKTEILHKFIQKLFFILKAASDGWIVSYIGGDEFEFSKHINLNQTTLTYDFVEKYTCPLSYL